MTVNYVIPIIILSSFFSLLSSSHCLVHKQPQYTLRDLSVEEKARLGSTPPSCHNKCNQCHPCMAVQVPPQPSHDRAVPSQIEEKSLELSPSSFRYSGYSNYKPIGWKCRCNGHFYNP